MADAVLGAIVAKAADIAGSRIIKETSRLSRVREDLVWIEAEMRHIRSYLKDADQTKKSRTEGVSNFIRDISDLTYDLEDIIDTYFPKMRINMSRWKRLLDFSNMRIARGFVKEVEGIRRRVEDIKNARQTFGIDESSQSHEEDTWHQRQSFPHLDEPNVVGFDNLIETLVHKVLDNDLHHRVVSIIGFPGLGKTTLARKVYKIARQSKVHDSLRQRFECAAWICVSQTPNIKALMRDIGGQVGLEKEKIEQNVETNLYEFLSTKRYVVVIDDIWINSAWDALKNGLPINSENGSRILLTSRNSYVGVHVGGLDSVLELKPLDRETSRRLFYKIVDDHQNICKTHPQLENIGEQILKKCGGVPLAIVLAAGLLKVRERSQAVWKAALDNMGQEDDQCAEIFALSYKDLPLNLKPCFLYFGIFPEDLEVEAFDLINLWAAEGFIRGSRVREVEEVGDDYLNLLVARNLIQVVDRRFDGRVTSVRIHDILLTLCIRVADEINFFNVCNTTLKVRRIVLHDSDANHYPALYPKTSSLRGAFSFGRRELWNSMAGKNLLRDSKFLRVLSVRVDFLEWHSISRSLLVEICNLRQLTYLKLGNRGLGLKLPYAIRNLKSLLTLDLEECLEAYLPNVIWSMKQLRHIILPYWCPGPSFCGANLDVFHPVEISLPNLQTLRCRKGDFFKAAYLHKLNSLRTLRVSYANKDIFGVLSDAAAPVPHKLEELWLSNIEIRQEPMSLNFSRYDNLSSLCIWPGVKLNELSHDELPPNLAELTLRRTDLRTDPMEALKKLQKLKILNLDYNAYLGKELVYSAEAGNFPQLEELAIRRLDNLELVVVEEGALPRLMYFKIVDCNAEIRVPDRIRDMMT